MGINAVKLKEVKVESGFNKDHPYIMDLSFSKYDFQKNGEQITGYSIAEINIHLLIYYICVQNGITRISFKTFQLFNHIVKCHVIAHAVVKYVEKIIIAFLIMIHTKMLSAIAMENT